MFKIAFQQMFDDFNLNLRKNKGFLTYIPYIPIPEYRQSNAPQISHIVFKFQLCQAKWTEGKIYCPKCKSRIGAFDYIHGVHCNCGKFTIPSIWIQKCRVDHISPQSRLKTLDVRKPKSLVFSLATNSSCDNGSNQMGDDDADISCHQNVASQHAVEENKYQGG